MTVNVPPKSNRLKNIIAFLKSAAFRDIAFAAILFLVEAVLVIRYGADTYFRALAEHQAALPLLPSWVHVMLAIFDVALLDGVFVLMVAIAKYAGQSDKASKIRVFAVVGASIMFLVMIGVATHTMAVVIAARWAGGLLLGYVGGDVLLDLASRLGKWIKDKRENSKPQEPFAKRLLGASLNLGYILAILILSPVTVLIGLLRVLVDYVMPLVVMLRSASNKPSGKVVLGKASATRLPSGSTELDDTGLRLFALWQADPHISNAEAARQVGGLSAEAVRQRKNKYINQERIYVNGNGVEVLEQ